MSALAPESAQADAAGDQRARLERAMVEAVSREGYGGTTVAELVRRAGVSKTTFYHHFQNKRKCFLATFEQIVDEMVEAVSAAYREPGELREKMVAALTEFMRTGVERPAEAALVAVDSLTLGADGVAHRERASERFEAMMDASLLDAPGAATMPPHTTRALVAGVRAVAYWRLRAGTEAELPQLVEPLIEWGLGYLQPPGPLTERAVAAATEPAPAAPPPPEDGVPGWEDPPDSPRSRRALTQRQRIVRAAARVVAANGYENLSIPAISGAAGVSNQTFYEHFEGKRDAFLAAFEELLGELVAVTAAAVEGAGERVEALGIGIRAMLEWIAANEAFARIAFFELPVAGPEALDRGDEALGAFTQFLTPGTAPSAFDRELPDVVREAIGGGLWGVIQFELHHGRRSELPALAPELARLALAPLERG